MKTIEQLGISPAPWKPGEWFPHCEDNIIRCDYHRKDGSPSTRIVANCNATFSHEQARADARLIAAAPDMYEALRGLLEIVRGDHSPVYRFDGKCPRVVAAEAALEKAGGAE